MIYEEFKSVKSIINEQSPEDEQSSEDEQDQQEPEEFEPLKKYQLVQKLFDFKERLSNNGIYNPDLDTIIRFSNELSYDTLVQLTDGILSYIQKQIERSNNDKNRSE